MAKGRQHRIGAKRTSTITLFLSKLLMLTIVVLLLLALGILSLPVGSEHISRPAHDLSAFSRKVMERDEGLGERDEQWVEILSWGPRAFLYHNFLSKEECEYLINLAEPHMVKSKVVDSKTGRSKDSRLRTSSGMFPKRSRDRVIQDTEE